MTASCGLAWRAKSITEWIGCEHSDKWVVRLDFVGQLGISPKESTRAEDAYIWTAAIYSLGFRG